MYSKTDLQDAPTEVLIATALECCRQQQELLSAEMDDDGVRRFEQLEDVRGFAVRQIDWSKGAVLLEHGDALRQLQEMDRLTSEQLAAIRDKLATGVRQLRRKRDVSSEYLSFQ